MNDPLTDLITDIQNNGIRWVTLVTIYAMYRKERRNHRLDQRDEALFHNLKTIMEDRGLGDQWRDGPKHGFKSTDLPNLKPLLLMFLKAMLNPKSHYLRRKKIMSISRKLLMAVFGAIILVLNQQLGWSLDPDSIIGACSLIISFIIGQSIVDTNGLGQYAPLIEKLKSKKLWTALVGSIVIVLNDTYHWGMSADSIYMLAGTGVSFIIGKSAISVVKAKNAGGSNDNFKTPVEPTE
jgi:hypothetical protein